MTISTLLNDTVGAIFQRTVPGNPGAPDLEATDLSAAPPDTRRLIRDRRYCNILLQDDASAFDDTSIKCAWETLSREMAFVPAGNVVLHTEAGVASGNWMELATVDHDVVPVHSTYMDRNCVTNADFHKFVQAGGYNDPNLWPEEILPSVLQFVDSTGTCGPRHWANGEPPADKLDHPVVGVCWYEASAYAIWSGKRLPTTTEWQRAGTWAQGGGNEGGEPRYPWGNAFDPGRANVWSSRRGDTCSISDFSQGQTPNGVHQLVGNVWEWVDAQYAPEGDDQVQVLIDHVMAEIRGGAFDTYFQTQATCQFRTGQTLLNRSDNIGFRCCVDADRLCPTPDQEITPSDEDSPC